MLTKVQSSQGRDKSGDTLKNPLKRTCMAAGVVPSREIRLQDDKSYFEPLSQGNVYICSSERSGGAYVSSLNHPEEESSSGTCT
jgi:hypothetical protein